MQADPLLDRFARLCEIPSPTGSERAVADAVAGELRGLGLDVVEDGAAAEAEAGAGNLIARLPGTGPGWVLFCAHLDTVPHDAPIEVVLEAGVFRSRGDTILGADNKAAVAVLCELAARAARNPPPIGLEFLLTVAEEQGLRGARALDRGLLRSSVGFVLDHASPIGEVITRAPTHNRLVAEFRGAEAHAGMRPEDGRSAIVAAATAIGAMRHGRLDPETTTNVGLISGGTSSNVVAGRCRVEAEARSLDNERAGEVIAAMVDACTWAATDHACDVDCEVTEMFRAYRVPPSAPSLSVAREALARQGFEPREVSTGGGSDANALIAAGFDCVLLANGTEANHTSEESVAAERLHQMLAVCAEAVRVAAERC